VLQRVHLFTLIVCALLVPLAALGQEYTIKFATLAPEGSSWIKLMRDYDKAIREQSGGRVGFKIYAGGVAGDEKDVVRKIRIGQYHAGGFTGVGIGEIAKDVRILDAPFLFKNSDEVDYITDKFGSQFEQSLAQNGFVLLGWAEVGFVYVFSNTPIASPQDLRGVKMWMWEGDPIAQAAFQAIGFSPIQLSITDVTTSLQTGMINAVYTSPYGLIALGWFTKMSYMMDVPIAISNGAVLLSKKTFDGLPKDIQDILVKNGRKYFRDLTLTSRRENEESIETLKKKGMKITVPAKDVAAQFFDTGQRARQLLVGRLFSAEFLGQVESSLATYRKEHASAK
jgi:TRAP-type C4-dicarboxylate transport system substrate-binding protein